MALRSKVYFRVVGFTLVGIGLLGFGLRLISKVRDGHALETYRSGTMIEWSYGAALVAFAVLGVAAIIGGAMRIAGIVMERREIKRLARSRANAANS
jgi:hypothetical protein